MPNQIQSARQILNSLFQNIKSPGVATGGNIPKGSVIRFGYRNWRRDPYPVVIVTSVSWGQVRKTDGRIEQPFIKGINLNYLTPFDFQRIIKNCGSPAFSYQSIMGDKALTKAYRHYLVGFDNILNLQMLDCREILSAREVSRAYDPNQADAIKESIRRQLQQQANVKADEMAKQTQQKFEFVSQQPEPVPGQQMQLPFTEEGGE
jgi:small nuclear ribonucleoprotein (snRNP)-like protein